MITANDHLSACGIPVQFPGNFIACCKNCCTTTVYCQTDLHTSSSMAEIHLKVILKCSSKSKKKLSCAQTVT